MTLTNSERQRKYRKKMEEMDYVLVRVWVPRDKVDEIKDLAVRLIKKEEIKNIKNLGG